MPVNYDWALLDAKLNPKESQIEFESVKHLFRKVAFDVYKPISGSEKLWELRPGDDGKEYLVALYGDEEDLVVKSKEEADSAWTAVADHDGKNITVSYRNLPITRIAIAQYGIESENADSFAQFVEKKATDQQFITELVSSLPKLKRESVMMLLSEEDS